MATALPSFSPTLPWPHPLRPQALKPLISTAEVALTLWFLRKYDLQVPPESVITRLLSPGPPGPQPSPARLLLERREGNAARNGRRGGLGAGLQISSTQVREEEEEERAMHTAHRPDSAPERDRLNANQGGDRQSLYSGEHSKP